MEKVFCINCKHYRPAVFSYYGKCTSQDVIEKYTKVISSTSHITGETKNYRVIDGSGSSKTIFVEGEISTIYGNGGMNCKYYEVKPSVVSVWQRVKKFFGR